MKIAERKGLWASLGILTATVLWGMSFVVVKSSLDFMAQQHILFYRYLIAFAAMALVYHRRLKDVTPRVLWESAVIGGMLFLAQYLQTASCLYTTAGKSAFITSFYVIIVPIMSWAAYRKRLDRFGLASVVMALCGLFLLTVGTGETAGSYSGDLLALGGSVFFAAQIFFIDRYNKRDDAILLAVFQFGFAVVYSGAYMVLTCGGNLLPSFTRAAVGSLIYMGVFSTMIAFSLQTVCQKYLPPDLVSLLLSMEAVFGMLFSVFLLHETLGPGKLLGCALMLSAVILSEHKTARRGERESA